MRISQPILALGAIAIAASGALGVPRETISFTGVASRGEAGDVANVVGERTLAGGYSVGRLRVSGILDEIAAATFASDARLFITPPGGQGSLIVQVFAQDGFSGSVQATDVFVPVDPAWSNATGVWRVRFYELFADSVGGADAIWDQISITLDDESLPSLSIAPAAGVYTEQEGNSSKARANRINSILPGERLTGFTTGGAAVGETDSSADYFRVTTPATSIGPRRHRLVLTSAASGHSITLRGLSQTQGFIAPLSDVPVQAGTGATSPTQLCQWFGFGREEWVTLRVVGTTTSTGSYEVVYSNDAATIEDAGMVTAGPLTIRVDAAADADVWVYDAEFRAIPSCGNDDGASSLSPHGAVLARPFSPGTYYLAVSDYNLANEMDSPPDDLARGGAALDPGSGVVLSGSTQSGVAFDIAIAGDGAPTTLGVVKPGPFEVVFVRFQACVADVDDGTGTGTRDRAVSIADLVYFLGAFEGGTLPADVDDGGGLGEPDASVTIDDLLYFLSRFEAGC